MLYPQIIEKDDKINIKERLKGFKETFTSFLKIFSNINLLSLFIVQKLHF